MKEPLFRKVNTRARRHAHRTGGDYRHSRNARGAEPGMARGVRRGLDYTPLHRFLLSRVGQPWAPTLQEARARIPEEAPIYWTVARSPEERREYVRTGESSYFSGLFVDDAGVLQMVAPHLGPADIEPACACCTWTLNGKPLTRKYRP
jgi:hypothetical protein